MNKIFLPIIFLLTSNNGPNKRHCLHQPSGREPVIQQMEQAVKEMLNAGESRDSIVTAINAVAFNNARSQQISCAAQQHHSIVFRLIDVGASDDLTSVRVSIDISLCSLILVLRVIYYFIG